jgi:squalene synthase HpnC
MPHMNNGFAAELARFGPEHLTAGVRPALAHSYCARLTHSHYENFSVASLLLPRRLLRHFNAIYAYCRWSDDIADEIGGGPRALELLRCYDGQPRHPVMVALQPTIRRFHIPPKPFLNLLFAFEQDQLVKRYQTYDQLRHYCEHSANPVGHLVLYLAEAFNEQRALLSDHICTGLQLTNFWQDVARDYAIGRVYLPQEDRQCFGYTEEDLQANRFTPAFAELLRFEVERTRELFYRGCPLVDDVPAEIQSDVELFIEGGLAILRKIEASGYDVWKKRPSLAKWEKGLLFASALWRHVRGALG